ncbi:hypothetical protein KEM56_007420 [Ascosphaera pollenicola]|nr:hypothetical protein KEM56_007420 [Ascosphaera pollenicola]
MRIVVNQARLLQCAAAAVLLLNQLTVVEAAEDVKVTEGDYGGLEGYRYGQAVPITCLDRDLSTGEHQTNDAGFLKWDPFPVCNETGNPLALNYGVSETMTCTFDSVSDELYHMLEFYVHHDVPLSCRIPSLPLLNKEKEQEKRSGRGSGSDGTEDPDDKRNEYTVPSDGGTGIDISHLTQKSGHPAYTPITIALQGTLQLSHLHIWTDMNFLLHQDQFPLDVSTDGKRTSKKQKKDKRKNKKKGKINEPGQITAATAYSLPFLATPEFPHQPLVHDLWAPGQGAKVVRGEPLTLNLQVHWIEQNHHLKAAVASHPAAKEKYSGPSPHRTVLSSMIYLIIAAGVGAIVAIWWERNIGNGKMRWKGEGLLGHPSKSSPNMGFFHSDGKVSIGTRGAMNGYGGYGGYNNGKRD